MTFPILSTKYDHVNIFINELAPVVCNEYLKRRDVGHLKADCMLAWF